MSNITQEDIDWIREGVQLHLDEMVKQMTAYLHGEQPEEQEATPRNAIRYEAYAIEYLINDLKRCVQYGTPIPKVLTK